MSAELIPIAGKLLTEVSPQEIARHTRGHPSAVQRGTFGRDSIIEDLIGGKVRKDTLTIRSASIPDYVFIWRGDTGRVYVLPFPVKENDHAEPITAGQIESPELAREIVEAWCRGYRERGRKI